MAFYDPALAPRIRRIKALQREHFLPLRVIKSVLEGRPSPNDDAEAVAAITRTLDAMALQESRTRAELVASGLPDEELAFFERLGLVTGADVDGHPTFRGDDLALLRLLGASRRAGITAQMLPAEILGAYAKAIGDLVRVELELFRSGVFPHAGGDLGILTDVATRLSEQLVVLIRRKMLLPTLRALVDEHANRSSTAPPVGTKRGRKIKRLAAKAKTKRARPH